MQPFESLMLTAAKCGADVMTAPDTLIRGSEKIFRSEDEDTIKVPVTDLDGNYKGKCVIKKHD